ncbi:universal stress protein [Taibaiella chishuiensis]|uniref:Nucleotide-binding universal stress UspA family protein n=1 Tax=Taibaiella chishuiensis TaxID=1434707 RepID=A0A2P8D1V3_9BACT|nr:universal stress protein [Taibaiella chishuiensis]PSK91199.1 nucleotide-binding universal stress UspA family protein [Taibaiella chishuiensis]
MKTIIVPTDFSAAATDAAHYAIAVAQQVQARIVLLHVLPLPLIVPEVPLPPDSYELALTDAGHTLKELKEELENRGNNQVPITCKTVTGSFVEEIRKCNNEPDVFAMIMGTSGAGAAEAFFLGSFSLTAAENLEHPVIVVPPGYSYKGIHKIGLACDMINVAETVPFGSIRALFDHFDARLEILYVSGPGERMYPQVLTESKFIQNNLAALRPEIRITTNDNIREGLMHFVQQQQLDLLLLLPKERNFVESLFHRSVTKKMVLHPEVPVMILHA